MRKILFSDVDGTLIHGHNNVIDEKNFKMMAKLREEGHIVALCTGRNKVDIRPTLKALPIPFDYLVLCNGGLILDKDFNTIYEKTIPLETTKTFLNECLKHEQLTAYFSNGEKFVLFKEGKTYLLEDDIMDAPLHFNDYLNRSKLIHMIGINQRDLKVDFLDKFIEKHLVPLKKDLTWFYNLQFVDIVPSGCSKGTGVKHLRELLGDEITGTYCIGDSFNDISMIHEADYGYTFNHADDSIKQEADRYVDYVYQVCEDILNTDE